MHLPDVLISDFKALLNKKLPEQMHTAIILGSGLGNFTDSLQIEREIPYHNLSAFPATSVAGHKGSLIWGHHNEKNILVFSGRFHFYEGHSLDTTLLPVQLASRFTPELLIISNAAGAINDQFSIGDLMLIEDVIYLGHSIVPKANKRFSYAHYQHLDKVHRLAAQEQIALRRGSYFYTKGPNYETKAEIRAFRRLGADVVGMSTAPELFEASKLSLKTAAISLVTNMASGVSSRKLAHHEIEEAAKIRQDDFARLVLGLIDGI